MLPSNLIWDAWVDPEKLESWYHPTDLSNVEGLTTSNPDIGGEWSIAVPFRHISLLHIFMEFI